MFRTVRFVGRSFLLAGGTYETFDARLELRGGLRFRAVPQRDTPSQTSWMQVAAERHEPDHAVNRKAHGE